jgi:hypothetical protein
VFGPSAFAPASTGNAFVLAHLRIPHPRTREHPSTRAFELDRIRDATYSSMMLPIACSLSGQQLAAQRETLLPGLAEHAVERTALPNGMRLRFSATAERMRQIDAVVRREHECCPFLEFRVGLALGGSSLTLDVTGPEGTADLLAELLDQSIAA